MENQELKLETAGLADLESLSQLVNSAYRGESSKVGWTTEADLLGGQRTDPQTLKKTIQDPESVILLYRQGQTLQACVNLVHKEKSCYLGMLTVSPELQAAGLGRKVLAAAEDFAKTQWRCQEMHMTVITIRSELMAWYERRGYQRTGEMEDFPYGNEKFGLPKRPDLKFEVLRKIL